MRCPKCGYISFDQEETCEKCSRPLPVSELEGTASKVENYLFLGSILGGTRTESTGEVVDADLEVLLQEETEPEVALEENGEEVPMVDLSQFEGDSEGEGSEDESDLELELEEEPEDDGIEFALEDEGGEEEVSEELETPLPEPEVKLDIDVDLDDEPEDGEIVFNLEDIDESDLVIDEDEEANEDENGETSTGDSESGSVPMDLAMEDGELIKEDKEKTEGSINLPDIDL